jgi:hypothetical protein
MKLEDLEAKLGIANMGEEDKLALVKDIQANLPALKAEQRSLEAKTQANLVVEAIKKIKEGLETRFDELNGIVDAKVRDITSGKDGYDGKDGKDGVDGKDGKDGISITGPKGDNGADGVDGVGVQDAHIDFDGSLIITLTDGRELNVGEVVPMDVAEKIKIIGNGGGTSQSVLDSLTSLQDQINTLTGIDGTLGTMAQQDANAVAITGGTINGATVGATTPAAGTFTTLTATGQTDLGGTSSGQVLRVNALTNPIQYVSIFGSTTGTTQIGAWSTNGSSAGINFQTRGGLGFNFSTNAGSAPQFNIAHTASAVNYVQVTGAATGGNPTISAQGSDATRYLALTGKGSAGVALYSNGGSNLVFLSNHVASSVNYMQVAAAVAGSSPAFSVNGTDTNIDLTLTPKGTGNVRFGTYTGTALSIAGYIEIKDAGGTVRKLAVVA